MEKAKILNVKNRYLRFKLVNPEKGRPYAIQTCYSGFEIDALLKVVDARRRNAAGEVQREIVLAYLRSKNLLKKESEISFQ